MSDAARWKATVYVGGLSQMATQSHVLDAFIPFGEIVEVKVPKPDAPNSTESHRGFAYVEYEDAADAKEAIDNMDQSEFFGKVLKVSQAKAPKSAEDGLGSKTAIWEKVFHNLKLIDNATDLSCRKDGWLSNMEQKMRMQYKILVLTLCKDWNNWTLQDQSLNEKGTLIFVTKYCPTQDMQPISIPRAPLIFLHNLVTFTLTLTVAVTSGACSSTLSGETEVLVDDELSGDGVGGSANSEANDNG
ncbi:hypothetical protein HG530_015687 [Fusarium avenaceum]|nr:hypothetical protein HG530_015687 [Fusarium avenaceum]